MSKTLLRWGGYLLGACALSFGIGAFGLWIWAHGVVPGTVQVVTLIGLHTSIACFALGACMILAGNLLRLIVLIAEYAASHRKREM